MLARLETMALGGGELPAEAVRRQIASALDIVVHLARFRDRSRGIAEICEVAGVEGGAVGLRTLYRSEGGEAAAGWARKLVKLDELRDVRKLRMYGGKEAES